MADEPSSTDLQEISDSGLLDRNYYLTNNADVQSTGLDALDHYCNFGWREGWKPNPYFDGTWYFEQYPDVMAAAMNPLLHYIRHGDREGRRPVPIFDSAWYRAAYAIAPEQLALSHFLTHRHGGLTLPSPSLFSALHIAPFADMAASGKDPFEIFVSPISTISASTIEADVIRQSGIFDANYYLLNGSDLFSIDADLSVHFCLWGWHEHRKPNTYFDTAWYLATNPAIARLSINPLAHYLFEGEAMGRRPIVYFDPLWYREKYGVTRSQSALAHFLARRRDQTVSPNRFFDPVWYTQQHGKEIGPGRDAFAHYLHAGTYHDVNPSAEFNAIAYRQRFLGRPSRLFTHLIDPHRQNPLVHYLRSFYR